MKIKTKSWKEVEDMLIAYEDSLEHELNWLKKNRERMHSMEGWYEFVGIYNEGSFRRNGKLFDLIRAELWEDMKSNPYATIRNPFVRS